MKFANTFLSRGAQGLRLCCLLIAAFGSSSGWAQDIVSRLFADHMVMQRGVPVPVWGWVKPGDAVTVSIDAQRKTATADAKGKWMVRLDPMAPGQPRKMTVASGAEKAEIDDILVGEVWLASGQSNMGFPLKQADGGKEAIASATNTQIRFFNVTRAVAPKAVRERLPAEPDGIGGDNTWHTAVAPGVENLSAVAYFFAVDVFKNLNVPIGIVSNAVGNSAIEAWISPEGYAQDKDFKAIAEFDNGLANYLENTPEGRQEFADQAARYAEQQAKLKAAGKPALWPSKYIGPIRSDGFASTFYNAMLYPVLPYAFRGVLWYQGEAQGRRLDDYRGLFPLLIKDWRSHFGQPALPFLFVQLPNWGMADKEPGPGGWALLREAQLLALRLPETAMAVTIDVGDPANIHPPNKRDVGSRLALAALATVYDKKLPYSGPIFRVQQVQSGAIRLEFDHIEGGLMVGAKERGGPVKEDSSGKLRQFAIAGADMKFVWADAMVEGNSVLVSSPQVAKPVAVRYAWGSNPEGANLYNRAGLPASPFRTDPVPQVEMAASVKQRLAKGFSLNPKK